MFRKSLCFIKKTEFDQQPKNRGLLKNVLYSPQSVSITKMKEIGKERNVEGFVVERNRCTLC